MLFSKSAVSCSKRNGAEKKCQQEALKNLHCSNLKKSQYKKVESKPSLGESMKFQSGTTEPASCESPYAEPWKNSTVIEGENADDISTGKKRCVKMICINQLMLLWF